MARAKDAEDKAFEVTKSEGKWRAQLASEWA